MSFIMSDYCIQLQAKNPEVAEGYKQKLNKIENVDPFALDDLQFSTNPSDFPPLTNMDFTIYLTLTTSYYTPQEMKAFKTLDAFEYFDAGFVSVYGAVKLDQMIVVVGEVNHSQKMDPPLYLWIMCKEDGCVETAHCTCMTELGEACNHIAALLYAMEYIVSSQDSTDVCTMWNVPTVSEVECTPVSSMNFGPTVSSASRTEVSAMTNGEIVEMLQSMEDAGISCALMRVVEPFATRIAEANARAND